MNTRRLGRLLVAAALVAAVGATCGCMTSGRALDPDHVAALTTGTTLQGDVDRWFGEPLRVVKPLQSHPKGCVERWIYVHQRAVGGSATTESLLVDFDAEGKVCDHAHTKRDE